MWLTVCQQIYVMCWAGLGRPGEWSSLSLCLSAGTVEEEMPKNIYIPDVLLGDAGAVDLCIFSLFVFAGLWVPRACRWEAMGFGKFLRSLLYVFFPTCFSENIKNLGYMFTSAHWEIIQILEKNMCNACF